MHMYRDMPNSLAGEEIVSEAHPSSKASFRKASFRFLSTNHFLPIYQRKYCSPAGSMLTEG
uniref:Uncharacterized protein n=1 Tax=Picea glauca TaxID=3330 RepID=A0A117NFV7_PICGL|nr:hypothetical protein ABT39_MTgene2366 [Picea glauca]QHR92254.1 hypothetical protein Q903MT_gene6293 [Picea sitchensis]